MKRKHQITVIFIFSLILLLEMNIYAIANLNNTPQYITEPNQSFQINKIIVDNNNAHAQYTSIQQALDDAQPGTLIIVYPGIYTETLEIRKSVCLQGDDSSQTIINPVSKRNGYAIYIGAENVELSGFTIQNNGPGLYTTGIKITAPKTTISDCNIYDTPVGIALWSSQNKILDCNFKG